MQTISQREQGLFHKPAEIAMSRPSRPCDDLYARGQATPLTADCAPKPQRSRYNKPLGMGNDGFRAAADHRGRLMR
jgi:hypothetical protein